MAKRKSIVEAICGGKLEEDAEIIALVFSIVRNL